MLTELAPHGAPATADEWQKRLARVAPDIASLVASVVESHADACVETFYSVLLTQPDATDFLSHQMVNTQLRAGLHKWLLTLFSRKTPDANVLVATQARIGAAHARIHVPIHIVMQGARLLKGVIRQFLFERDLSRDTLFRAISHVGDMIDIAVEFMSQAFVQDLQKGAVADEAYRLVSLGQDVTLEREIQRSALLDWSHKLLFNLWDATPTSVIPLEKSDFGLWLTHKGNVLFQGTPGIEQVRVIVSRIDAELVPALVKSKPPASALIQNLQTTVNEIRFLIDQLFKETEAVEGGRDPLTHMLNRRFLPTILGREVKLSLHRGTPFSVLMLDVDHFKAINTTLGHSGGDSVLRGIAELIVDACRVTDFIFRYGGEEFLIALVETDREGAWHAAERIRQTVEQNTNTMGWGEDVRVTISIGIATFDGHPDYTHLIEEADRALYAAKAAGRNRCVASTETCIQSEA
ncbi:diguanylate cyclase [Tanticharoenia sakaeratensis]|uniref:Diguanylate cyclase DosC n=1 Tax=Tanticharoenia sakaeratensis NBRC 103193 TaxID=1231623 RepID=A0A0D6MQP8_9PROT|nr:diguanylate cyclase [Tanticharoenia sakaeratensis]GAN55756.1 diguanylate cyclase [Tanticharoenia sakaeratensis NBRC 103193]GBQ18554.1 diguanylate cyclase [Tanticharoenia sakaeratensis NBRC 103193]